MNIKVCTFVIIFGFLSINSAHADGYVYGGGKWEVIGIGNLPCDDYLKSIRSGTYKDTVFDWVSGFMSGVNYSSKGVYDITSGDDIETFMQLIEKYCTKNTSKTVAQVASDIAYSLHHFDDFKESAE